MKHRVILIACLVIALSTSVFAATSKEAEKAKIKMLVKSSVSMQVDDMIITMYKDWAFVDAWQNSPGTKEALSSTSVLLRKKNNKWRVLATGGPTDAAWQQYIKQMPSDVKKAFNKWDSGHY